MKLLLLIINFLLVGNLFAVELSDTFNNNSNLITGTAISADELNLKINNINNEINKNKKIIHEKGSKAISSGSFNEIAQITIPEGTWMISGGISCYRTANSNLLQELTLRWSESPTSTVNITNKHSITNIAFSIKHDTSYSESGFEGAANPVLLDSGISGRTIYLINSSSSSFSGNWTCSADIIAQRID